MARILNFTKMNALGNDYIYIDCFKEPFSVDDIKKYGPTLCQRNFGIGSDGIILIMPSKIASAKMRMFNPDTSEGEMCGNGLRCVVRYIYDNKYIIEKTGGVETGRGVLKYSINTDSNNNVGLIDIDMDKPILEGLKIPTTIDKDIIIDYPLEIEGKLFYFTAISMGNPHIVIYVDDLDNFDVNFYGHKIEYHKKLFPNRCMVNFVEIVSRDEVKQRTWERGTGETLACGTGASSVCVASVLKKLTNNTITSHLRGGDLKIRYDGIGSSVIMSGITNYSFKGSINLDTLELIK